MNSLLLDRARRRTPHDKVTLCMMRIDVDIVHVLQNVLKRYPLYHTKSKSRWIAFC